MSPKRRVENDTFFQHVNTNIKMGITMNINVGKVDRIARFILAAVAIFLIVAGLVEGTLMWVAVAAAVILGGTAMMSSCPLYSLLGISSCPLNKNA